METTVLHHVDRINELRKQLDFICDAIAPVKELELTKNGTIGLFFTLRGISSGLHEVEHALSEKAAPAA